MKRTSRMKKRKKRKGRAKEARKRKTKVKVKMSTPISKNRLIILPVNKVTLNQKTLKFNQTLMRRETLSVLWIKMQVSFQSTKGL